MNAMSDAKKRVAEIIQNTQPRFTSVRTELLAEICVQIGALTDAVNRLAKEVRGR